jgi:CubicO group peptidase (beta-lactamase class C family)
MVGEASIAGRKHSRSLTKSCNLRIAARNFLFGMTCLLVLGPRATQGEDHFAGMDAYIRMAMDKWEVPGLAIAVVKDGEMVLAKGYGVCELGSDRKVGGDTVFTIASCSKPMVAACMGILVEEGKVRWDDPVAKHLPGFELSDPYLTERVTLRDLLCHRTGLRRCDLLCDRGDLGPAEILRRLKHVPLVADWRTKLTLGALNNRPDAAGCPPAEEATTAYSVMA